MSRKCRLLLAILLASTVACSPQGPDTTTDGGEEDGGTVPDSGGGVDAGDPDAGQPGTLFDGGDAGSDAGVEEPLPPKMTAQCFEAEALASSGSVTVNPGPPETDGGTVILGANGAGQVQLPFTLDIRRPVRVWVRVRAVTHNNNSLTASLETVDTSDAATWDIPVTPVLRWEELTRRGATGTFYRQDQSSWPGWLDAGPHTLVLSGREPQVELDAVCIASPDDTEPEERFAEAPQRPITKELSSYGAVGDGTTDDTAAIQAALSALQPGDALHLGAGRYRITSALTLTTTDVSLIGDGRDSTVIFADIPVTDPVSGTANTGQAFTIAGGQENNSVPLNADAAMLDRSVLVSNAATFKVGDTVFVNSNDWGPPAPYINTPFYRLRANHARVTSVTAVTGGIRLGLDRPLLSPFYTQYGAKAWSTHPLRNVVVQGFKMEGTSNPLPTDNADIDLMGAKRCERCFFIDMGYEFARKSNLDVYRSFETQIIGADVSNVTDTGGGGHGYGITVNQSQAEIIRDSYFHGVLRHGIPVSWGSREAFIFRNLFDRSVPHTNKIASVDIHGEDDYCNLVERNTSVGGQPGIVIGGGGTSHGNDGEWNVVRGNHLENTIDGVDVSKSSYHEVIEGNTVLSPQGYGIRVDSGSDNPFVWNNDVENYVGAGVSIDDADNADIRRNSFVPGTGPAVRITNASGYSVIENSLGGGTIDDPGSGTVAGNQ